MNQQLLIQVLEGVLFFVAAIALILTLLAGVYDLRAISQRQSFALRAKRLRRSRQPWVTILVRASSDSLSTITCLRSIAQSHYKNYDIVVIDAGSMYSIKRAVRNYIRKNPKAPLSYYHERKISSSLELLQRGYAMSRKGELVLVLDAPSIISPMFLKNSVARFVSEPTLTSLHLNEYSDGVGGLTQLISRLRQLSARLISKSASIVSVYRVPAGTPSVLYRRDSLIGSSSLRSVVSCYEGTIGVKVMQATHVGGIYVILLAGMVCFVTYSLYLAMTLEGSSLLMLSWAILFIWLLLAIWSDEMSGRREKIALTFSTPSFYFLLYSQLIIFGVLGVARAVVRVLPNHWWIGHTDDRLAERPL